MTKRPGDKSEPDRLLRYWKTIKLGVAGFSFELVPEQTIRESKYGKNLFEAILEEVRESDCDYSLVSEQETLISSRGLG